ncbi:hypothetical protein O181_057610 [Austropuccinia psidii MF-1]|uniref:Transposase Tc1-like domain-containing protein n=1 Tax=Austropuccinia psidii MF-1 TaxID=1389203 RepID=A0A9Q3EEY4_9BASI|nr:hypothetical protein [Austropuccinia psidii MF-1]
MRTDGTSIQTTRNHLQVPSTTVHDTICKHQEHGHLKLLSIPGRPRKLNDCELRQLSHVVQQNQCKKLAKIKKLITIDVSINTLQIVIHKDLGKQSCIAVKKPYLSPVHMEQGLKFARQHLNWTRVIWTDELSFELGKWLTRTRVWLTPQERYELESMTVNHQSGQRSFMVWGSLCRAIQSKLVFLPPGQHSAINFISNFYEPSLLPFYDELIDAGVVENYSQLTLMEDGAPIHMAQVSNDWRHPQTSMACKLTQLKSNQEYMVQNEIHGHQGFQSKDNGRTEGSSQFCMGGNSI